MTVYVVQMKEPRIPYPNHSEKGFLTIKEYLQITKKIVKHVVGKTNSKIATEILRSDDVLSNIATAIMISDWRYESGEGASIQTYRYGGALQAIKTYLKRRSNKKFIYSLDLDLNDDNNNHDVKNNGNALYDKLEDDSQHEPILEDIKNDNHDSLIALLDGDTLNDKEKICINKYFFDSMTYQKIGDELGITRERVRQIIDGGLSKLKEALDDC